jgi:hypothetical protein
MADEKSLTVAGPFRTRRKARAVQKAVQRRLYGIWEAGGPYQGSQSITLEGVDLPVWAHGVRVEPMSRKYLGVKKQYSLVATSDVGH